MFEISRGVLGHFEAKGSKFLAFLEPCADIRAIRERQAALRAEHPKSVHVVYAARALNEHGQIAEDFSDDGEPKGSSAAPMLAVLRGADVLAAAYVVRYFGGTLLGIGGLVRAYSAALNDALEVAKSTGALACYIPRAAYLLNVGYEQWRQVEFFLTGLIYHAEYAEQISVHLELSEQEASELGARLEPLRLALNRGG